MSASYPSLRPELPIVTSQIRMVLADFLATIGPVGDADHGPADDRDDPLTAIEVQHRPPFVADETALDRSGRVLGQVVGGPPR